MKMKKVLLVCMFLLSGCYANQTESDVGEVQNELNCVTCRDILVGADYSSLYSSLTACNGTSVLWGQVQNWACRRGSQCYSQCGSLCSYNGISQNCEACLLLPSSQEDYLNCNMVGNQ